MNKKLLVGLTLLTGFSYANGADNFKDMFSEGKVYGQIRIFYLDRKFQGTQGVRTHRNSTAIGGHLKFETDPYKNIGFGAAFYTTNAIRAFDRSVLDPSLLGTNQTNYTVLGEAYMSYDFKEFGTNTKAKLGYQRFDTPMISSDDCRMVPNTFEAYKIVNKDIKNLTLQIAQIRSVAYGTYSNLFQSSGIVSTTSGYSSLPFENGVYYNVGKLTTGKNTAGITSLLLKYKNKNFFVTASNDYAWDLYNTLYLEGGVNWQCMLNDEVHPFVKIQYIKQNSVGKKYMRYSAMGGDGVIDSSYVGLKTGANYKGLSADVAYSHTGSNSAADDVYKNAINTQFGGMPAYTVDMVVRHQFLAGTDAWKYTLKYDFKRDGLNLNALFYFGIYNMDEYSGYGMARRTTEAGYDIKYYPKSIKGLELRARANFPRKFAQDATGDKGWNEYRFIVNYNF